MITLEEARLRGIRPWVWYASRLLTPEVVVVLSAPLVILYGAVLGAVDAIDALKLVWKSARGMRR